MPNVYRLIPALAMHAALSPVAAASWAPVRSIGEGAVNRLVADGSRVCAATFAGVYCRDRGQEAWRSVFFEGRFVRDLVKTRSGWAVFVSDWEAPANANAEKVYISRDGGTGWTQAESAWYGGRNGQQALGDSLVRNELGKAELSVDGGETWQSLPPAPEALTECTLRPGMVLCVSRTGIFGYAAPGQWKTLGSKTVYEIAYFSGGRIYIRDSSYAVSIYGAAGLERKIAPLPGYYPFFLSDSLILAWSGKDYAFARGGDSAWTLSLPTHTYFPFHPMGGIWKDGAALIQGFDTPWKARIESGRVVFEPYGQGIPNLSVRLLLGSGRSLFAKALNGVWKLDADGDWKPFFRRASQVAQFDYFEGKAMVNSFEINGEYRPGAPPLFTDDSGETWQDQPASLPGIILDMARMGDGYLALTAIGDTSRIDSSVLWRYSLFEAAAWMGPWKFRADYSANYPSNLIACGSRLFAMRPSYALMSLDTGKSWIPTGYQSILEAGGDRVYAIDSAGGLWESRHCEEPWSRVSPALPDQADPTAVNRTAGEPLLAVYMPASGLSHVRPLPGSSRIWAGVETHTLRGRIMSLASRDGLLYAVVLDAGLYVLDMRTIGIRNRPSGRRAAPARPPIGWRRIDGRAIPPGIPGGPAPLFPAGPSRPLL